MKIIKNEDFQKEFNNISLDKWVDFINDFAKEEFLLEEYDKNKTNEYCNDSVNRNKIYKICFLPNSRYGEININWALCIDDTFYHCMRITPFEFSSSHEFFRVKKNKEFFKAIKSFINKNCPHYKEVIHEEVKRRIKEIEDELSI